MKILNNDWGALLNQEFEQPYYVQLHQFLLNEYHNQTIYPDKCDIFNALHYTPYSQVKVVILGQDPYHGPGQAHGLSFSVKPGIPTPPSLQNIFKELQADVGCSVPNHGYLVKWAEQGVLLLNTVLTVRKGEPNSHKSKGWELFTDQVIHTINNRKEPVVFILWGANAQAKEKLISSPNHYILRSPHPSPLSAYKGFFGSRPFSKANHFLQATYNKSIDWQLNVQ
jgi:uracil-DNA glycosylase